ncbi:MAG: hypothetical protein LUI13_12105 [Lachnospiraceae bacterium]|nr:hypothetical protein [Lachnospiraceae bacterium]
MASVWNEKTKTVIIILIFLFGYGLVINYSYNNWENIEKHTYKVNVEIEFAELNDMEFEKGSFYVTGEDPYIILEDQQLNNVRRIAVNFADSFTSPTYVSIYYAGAGDNFTEENCATNKVSNDENSVLINIDANDIVKVRIDIDSESDDAFIISEITAEVLNFTFYTCLINRYVLFYFILIVIITILQLRKKILTRIILRVEHITNCVMKRTLSKPELVIVWVATIVSIIRICLSYNTPVYMIENSLYDDANLRDKAISLLQGDWLGEYNQYTLIKGITYSLFYAVCSLSRIPYTLLLSLLIIAASIVFVRTIKNILPFKYTHYLLYVFLIFSPITFDFSVAQRLYRNSLVFPLVLFIFSGILGIYLNLENFKIARRYSTLAGVSLFFFWNLREDSIWILPFIVTAIIISFIFSYASYRKSKNSKILLKKASILMMPFIFLFAGNMILSSINYTYYGIFTTNDRTDGVFADVVGLFIKIDYEEKDTNLDETKCFMSIDKFGYIIDHSESLAEYKEIFLTTYNAWANGTFGGNYVYGDHIQWIFRIALTNAGFYQDAITTQDYLKDVCSELEEEISKGNMSLKKGIFLSSSTKMMTINELPGYFITLFTEMLPKVVSYSDTIASSEKSSGTYEVLRSWEGLVNSYILYPEEEENFYTRLASKTVASENKIIYLYQSASGILWGSTIIFFFLLTVLQIFNIKWKDTELFNQWLIACAMLLSTLVSLLIFTIFSGWDEGLSVTFYCSGAFPLIQIFEFLSISAGISSIRRCKCVRCHA